jgi:hypothetical protein
MHAKMGRSAFQVDARAELILANFKHDLYTNEEHHAA